jgi:hypothetical protein
VPIFWLGDDLTIFHKARLNESNKKVWIPAVANPSSQWKGIVDRRANQRYTTAHIALLAQTGLYWQPGMVGKLLNTDYFRNDMDPKFAYLANTGLVSALAVGFHSDIDDGRHPLDMRKGAEPLKQLAKYVVARYGAYPMIWSIVEPDQSNVQTRIDRWREVGLEFNAHDAYNHPQTVWYWGTAYGNKPTHYLNDSPRWVDVTVFFPTAYNTEGSTGTLHNLTAARYTAKWFNPRTGVYIPISTSIRPKNGNWAVPPKPQNTSYLLQVVANRSL